MSCVRLRLWTLSIKSKSLVSAIGWIGGAFILINLIAWPGIGSITADAPEYIKIAQGHPALQPFAGRAAIPKLAFLVGSFTGIGLENAFLLLKGFALLGFLVCVWAISVKLGADPRLLLSLAALTPGVTRVYALTFLPDFELVALSAATLLAWIGSSPLGLLFSITGASVVREVGLLIGLALALAAMLRRDYALSVAALAGGAAGAVMAQVLAADSPGNVHQMPALAYFALKIPVNLTSNWFGIRFFTSTGFTCEPRVATLPVWISEAIRFPGTVGICWPDFAWVIRTLLLSLGTLGILPTILIASLIARSPRTVDSSRQMLDLVILGTAVWFLGTVSGTWIDKLVALVIPFALVTAASAQFATRAAPRRVQGYGSILALHGGSGFGSLALWEWIGGQRSVAIGLISLALWISGQIVAYLLCRAVDRER